MNRPGRWWTDRAKRALWLHPLATVIVAGGLGVTIVRHPQMLITPTNYWLWVASLFTGFAITVAMVARHRELSWGARRDLLARGFLGNFVGAAVASLVVGEAMRHATYAAGAFVQ